MVKNELIEKIRETNIAEIRVERARIEDSVRHAVNRFNDDKRNNTRSNDVYNMMTSLMSIHERLCKLEEKERMTEYLGFMSNCEV